MQHDTPFLALDLELNQPSRRIIQVGICLGDSLQAEEEYLMRDWLVDPGEPLDPRITELTGISEDDIRARAVPLEQVARELGECIQAHGPFVNPVTWGGGDRETLQAAFREAGIEFPFLGRREVDVKTHHSFLCFAQGKNPAGGLGKTMAKYRLRFLGEAHRAHFDALNTLRLFFRLLERQRTLDALTSLAKQV